MPCHLHRVADLLGQPVPTPTLESAPPRLTKIEPERAPDHLPARGVFDDRDAQLLPELLGSDERTKTRTSRSRIPQCHLDRILQTKEGRAHAANPIDARSTAIAIWMGEVSTASAPRVGYSSRTISTRRRSAPAISSAASSPALSGSVARMRRRNVASFAALRWSK